ncbi:MAG TPA: DUF47 family protein [Verrucomicrobiae bacterium]|nr:DUF47 family protein [Verrucomicrobiae bacterium]
MLGYLKGLLGHDGKFYDLLEASAMEARESAALLVRLMPALGSPEAEKIVGDLADRRRTLKRLRSRIIQDLCRTFVTPLEREDIEALSSALYRVPKTVQKIAGRLLVCPPEVLHDVALKQVGMLDEASVIVVTLVGSLRKRLHGERIEAACDKLQTIEGDADRLVGDLLASLYQGSTEAKRVIILKDLYELLEKAIDLCRDVGNVVFHVILKYS